MKQPLLYQFCLLFFMLLTSVCSAQFNPTDPALGFNVFLENNASLVTNESEGPVAIGGDLNVNGYYQVNIHNQGTFEVGGVKIGLLVGGKVFYNSGILRVNQKRYVKIGVNDGSSTVWYKDPNNATPPIRITPGPYDAPSAIHLQANATELGVSASQNPVFQSGLINFTDAFTKMRNHSADIASCVDNATVTTPNGVTIPTPRNYPSQIKIKLNDGVNVLNLTGAELNSINEITYVNKPSASKILIINIDAPGVFNWKVWNQPGIGFQDTPYILYNFQNTTSLNIYTGDSIKGTVFSPSADIDKTGHNSNIEGQVIAKSFIQNGGEIHYGKFNAQLTGCSAVPPKNPPVAKFDINQKEQCFTGNSFVFTDQSQHGETYHWDFGDGTVSTDQNPTKSYVTSGNFNVTLTVTNPFGSDSKTKTVTVWPPVPADVSITGSVQGAYKVTKEFTLTNSGDFTHFAWILPGTNAEVYDDINPISIEFTVAGYYELKVVTKDKNGCSGVTVFPITIECDEVGSGHGGGVESHSLGDAISKINLQRKKNNIPTVFDVSKAEKFDKAFVKAGVGLNRGAQPTMLEMFPTHLIPGDEARVSSPTDILDYTIAKEVLSVDFVLDGSTKGVVLGIRTEDRVYNHTKASCDRLRGAEILNVRQVELEGFNFLMQAIKQRDGKVEYAISFAVGKNNDDNHYSLQTNWYVNEYGASNQVYNFQAWTTNPEGTEQLVIDILKNLQSFSEVEQTEIARMPQSYVSKAERDAADLVLTLRNLQSSESVELVLEQNSSETQGYRQHYVPLTSEPEQTVRLSVGDAYEFDGLLYLNGKIQDAFYQADGNWGLDYDSAYTTIEEYTISNNPNRVYHQDELAVHRNVKVRAHSEYDYLIIYKSLLPGGLSADYSGYNFVSFTAKGSGWLDVGLIKSSITDWKDQFKVTIDVGEEEETFYIPFEYFRSSGSQAHLTPEDLTMLTFTFLPVEAGTNNLNLSISDVKFTRTAPVGYQDGLVMMHNQFVVYPNPSRGEVNCILYSKESATADVTLFDITGRVVHSQNIQLTKGRNEIGQSFAVPSGVYFIKIANTNTHFGTTKLILGN